MNNVITVYVHIKNKMHVIVITIYTQVKIQVIVNNVITVYTQVKIHVIDSLGTMWLEFIHTLKYNMS